MSSLYYPVPILHKWKKPNNHVLKCQIKNTGEVDTQSREVKSQREHHQWLHPSISRSTVRPEPLGPSSPSSPFLSILCKENIKVNDTKSYMRWGVDFINFIENIYFCTPPTGAMLCFEKPTLTFLFLKIKIKFQLFYWGRRQRQPLFSLISWYPIEKVEGFSIFCKTIFKK